MKLRTRSIGGSKMYIAVLGRFDFSLHQEFRAAMESMEQAESCHIDLREVPYMDSSALGMLSLARRRFQRLEITGTNQQIRDMLRMAGFSEVEEAE